MKTKIAVIGGDLRQYAVAKELSKYFCVCASGLSVNNADIKDLEIFDKFEDAIASAEAVVLPLPASTDGNLLNCPTYIDAERISLDRIVEVMTSDAILIGGRIPQNTVVKALGRGIKVYDYFLSEKLQIKNAYITAEAAVSIAMNSLDKCIKDSKLAVTGSGRIARLLADLLRKLGADVTVAARNADSLVYYELIGCNTVLITDNRSAEKWNKQFEKGYDIIFNTVPSWLFDREFLENADKELLIIELASAPGGVDICAARELMSNVLWASSLPGKYAPGSAGMLIAECIRDHLNERGGLL